MARVDLIEEEYSRFPDETNRTVGTGVLHLTDIIKRMDQTDYTGVKWNMNLTPDCGFIWERALEMAYKDKLGIRPNEIIVDGIVGSPDGVGDDPWGEVDFVNEEYKLTWKSSNNPIESNWYYITQFKSYCKMLGTRVTVVRIIYVVGDYKGSGPQYFTYRLEFTQKEIDENWAYIRQFAINEGMLEE